MRLKKEIKLLSKVKLRIKYNGHIYVGPYHHPPLRRKEAQNRHCVLNTKTYKYLISLTTLLLTFALSLSLINLLSEIVEPF